MPLELRQHENVLYPMPYVPTEKNLFIVTNQRIIHDGPSGHQELAANEVGFVGRTTVRPLWPYGLLLLLAALPLFGVALWQLSTVWGMESAPLLAAAGETRRGPAMVLERRLVVGALALAGLVFALGGLRLLRRKDFLVLCRAGQRVIRVRAKDSIQQTQILMTVSAIQGKSA